MMQLLRQTMSQHIKSQMKTFFFFFYLNFKILKKEKKYEIINVKLMSIIQEDFFFKRKT